MRNTRKYAADKGRKPFAAALKIICHAASEEKALEALENVTAKWTKKYLDSMKNREQDRQRRVFPSGTAILKALYLATFEAAPKMDHADTQLGAGLWRTEHYVRWPVT